MEQLARGTKDVCSKIWHLNSKIIPEELCLLIRMSRGMVWYPKQAPRQHIDAEQRRCRPDAPNPGKPWHLLVNEQDHRTTPFFANLFSRMPGYAWEGVSYYAACPGLSYTSKLRYPN